MSLALARGLEGDGHVVTVVTHTAECGPIDNSMKVVRAPTVWKLLKLYWSSDVVFHNNINLKFWIPKFASRRPAVYAIHNWIRKEDGTIGWKERIKRFIISRNYSTTVSKAVAEYLPFYPQVISNSFDSSVFFAGNEKRTPYSVAFVGRLAGGKGLDVLFDMAGLLRAEYPQFSLTVIGDGPLLEFCAAKVRSKNLSDAVQLLGSLAPTQVSDRLRRSEILVVPSTVEESFGLVALEGIACGAYPVTSNHGGLPEAVGACGTLVLPGDPHALAEAIKDSWQRRSWESEEFITESMNHLTNFSNATMIRAYGHLFERVRQRPSPRRADAVQGNGTQGHE